MWLWHPRYREGEEMFRKILYPTDFSPSARAALPYVRKLKEAGAEEVILLHVFDERNVDVHWEIQEELHPEEPPGQTKHEVLKMLLEKRYARLKELECELTAEGFKTELVVVEGVPYREIVKTADDMAVSLIVMGSHGERGLVEKLVGSTTSRVISHTNVPVLVVRPRSDATGGQ